MCHLQPRQVRAGMLFPTNTFLFSYAVILEGCVPNGRVQDGAGSPHQHWTEKCERNKVSVKTLISWGLLTANRIYLVIILA